MNDRREREESAVTPGFCWNGVNMEKTGEEQVLRGAQSSPGDWKQLILVDLFFFFSFLSRKMAR